MFQMRAHGLGDRNIRRQNPHVAMLSSFFWLSGLQIRLSLSRLGSSPCITPILTERKETSHTEPAHGLAVQQSVTSQRLPTEREILELAEMTSYVFDSPDAVGLKERLKEQAEVYRDWLRCQQHLKDEANNASLGTDEQGYHRVATDLGCNALNRALRPHISLGAPLSHLLRSFLSQRALSGFYRIWERSWSYVGLIRDAIRCLQHP